MLLGALMWVAIGAFGSNLATNTDIQWFLVIAGAWNLLLIIVTIVVVVVVVDSIRKIRAKKTQLLATDVLVVKLAAIPFFALNFVALLMLTIFGAGMFLFGGLVLWVVAGVGIGLTYLAILSTSVYAWAAIAQLRREGIIKPWLAVLCAILSLIPVTDTATGVLLFGQARRRPMLALVIVMLSFALTFASVVLGLYSYFNQLGGGGSALWMYGFGWIGIVGVVALLAAMVGTVALLPALRREARGREYLPGGFITDNVTSDHALGR
jgi:hypothetical protein